MKLELFKISELKLDPENARRHNAKNLAAISKSFDEFDQLKNIVVDKNNVVIAGNGTVQTFIDKGKTEIWGVRSPLSPAKNKAFALADNRTAELAEWDTGNLQKTFEALRAADIDLGSVGFEPADLDDLGLAPKNEGLIEDDAVPEVAQNIHGVKLGDIWQLGEHRVMCGDSTKKEDVERLMAGEKADMVFTDPPYGIDILSSGGLYGDGKRHGNALAAHNKYKPVEGDKDLRCVSFLFDWLKSFDGIAIVWGANNFPQFISPSNGWLVWDKEQHARQGDCELAWTNQDKAVRKFTHKWVGFQKASERGEKRVHPTQKPIALAEWAFDLWDKPISIIDLFIGSGSTLIACEKTNRKCYGMEIDPHYCSVIIERWQQFSGKKAELITT